MKHVRVLIADHDRRLRTQLSTRLLDVEVSSDCVSTADEAVQYLHDCSYGLILLDLELENDGASTIIDRVRALPAAERPMVLATASRELRTSVDPDLVQIVIRKPVRVAEVAAMIRSCVSLPRKGVSGGDQRLGGPLEFAGGDEYTVRVVS